MTSSPTQEPWVDRNFTRLLFAIAAAGLIPSLIVSHYQFIGGDGWWHLFIATQNSWIGFLSEWRFVAHPPLFYPLLRFVAMFGHSRLMVRSVGIICGGLASYQIGIIASKIYRYKAAALLVAIAYTFSWSMIEINSDLRAYPLALLFILLAFSAYLDWVADPAGPRASRAVVRFGVWGTLAMMSEFYVVFFLAACVAVLALRFVVLPLFRSAFLTSIRTDWKPWLFSCASLTVSFVALYTIQIQGQPNQGYLKNYYWDENSPLGLDGFLLTNIQNELRYVTPFNMDTAVMLSLVCLLFLPALLYFTFFRKNRWRGPFSADPPLLLAGLLAQLVVLSLAARHPFGGELRHQSIILPFVFLTAFVAVDSLASAFKVTMLRNALFMVVGVLSAANFAFGWSKFPWDPVEPNTGEYSRFQKLFADVPNLYSDGGATLYYFMQHHDSRWTLQDRFLIDATRVTVYQVDDGDGRSVRLYRNKKDLAFDFANLETYQILADLLRHENLKSIVLFYQGPPWSAEGTALRQDRLRSLAPEAGLEIGQYSFGVNYAFIEIRLR